MNKSANIVLSAVILMVFFSPASLLAQTPTTTDEKPERVRDAGVCEAMGEFASRAQSRAVDALDKVHSRFNDSGKVRASKWDERDGQRDERRAAADARREEAYNKLRERSDSPEWQTAVETFVGAIDDAVLARRAAIDDAVSVSREESEALAFQRRTQNTLAVEKYRDSVSTAGQEAIAACNDGDSDLETIRNTFREKSAAARVVFKEELKSSQDQFRSQYEATRSSYRASVDAAVSQFRLAVDAAREELRAAFIKIGSIDGE